MKVVAVTGGIGSGKSTVASFFEELGIPVYIADIEAKKIMKSSKVVKRKLIKLLGEDAYVNDELNKTYIANKIFNNEGMLKQINAIVHKKVALHFNRWLSKQTTAYVIKESAILFENKLENQVDIIITVTASKENKIKRLLLRDNTSLEKIDAIMSNQMSDKEKIKKSHYVIYNNKLEDTKQQVLKTHKAILKLI